jgi:PhoPQ-activated pathogenicity-related protein
MRPCRTALALLALAAPAFADLDEYLKRPEPEAKWEKKGDETVDGLRIVTLNLTSQVWRGIPWKHDLRVFIPAKIEVPGLAALLVTGGRAGDRDKLGSIGIARTLGAPFAILYGVPNQPLFGGKYEDDLIAHTFEEYVKSGDEEWPLLFPMVKSAVKAMDALQELAAKEGTPEMKRFMVTGGSKRGWTTWLTGAVDPRVAGISPMVYDNLNLGPQMKNQVASWGGYSDQIIDYTRRNLQALLETENGRKLVARVDPYAFRDRLERVPKLILVGTNDPYWPCDSINLYWDGLKGEKAVVYVPNGGHGIGLDNRSSRARLVFFRRLGAGKPLPALAGEFVETDGKVSVRMTCEGEPIEAARLWTARGPTRDLRKAKWESVPAAADGPGFSGTVDGPGDGFVGVFGEADFKDGTQPFSLSTTLRVFGGATSPR